MCDLNQISTFFRICAKNKGVRARESIPRSNIYKCHEKAQGGRREWFARGFLIDKRERNEPAGLPIPVCRNVSVAFPHLHHWRQGPCLGGPRPQSADSLQSQRRFRPAFRRTWKFNQCTHRHTLALTQFLIDTLWIFTLMT